MKILIADRISPIGVDLFKAQKGFDVIEAYGSSPEDILELAKDADAIAVRSDTRITAEVIAVAPNLKVVGRAGVGVDNIDIEAATDHGVIVMAVDHIQSDSVIGSLDGTDAFGFEYLALGRHFLKKRFRNI